MLRFIKWAVAIALVSAVAAAGFAYWYVEKRPIELEGGQSEIILKVKPASTVRNIASELLNAGVKVDPNAFQWVFKYFGSDRSIHVGRYLIKSGMTLKELVKHISSGEVIMSKFTLIEGTETAKLLKKIAADDNFEHPHGELSSQDLMKEVGAPEGTHPEGQFAADTYVFAAGVPDTIILRRMYREQQQRLNAVWESRDKNIVVKTPYELLILASLIEKETGDSKDRTLVSSVFNNRLKKGMLLQTDPTVVYGIENFDGRILKSHLKTDHPYNTYTRAGLPPTPICNPGEASLVAAAHPAQTDYLYFVAKGNSGQSHFSKTLKEHNAAVQKYLRNPGS